MTPPPNAIASRSIERDRAAAQLRRRLRDDERAEQVVAELERPRDREVAGVAAERELDRRRRAARLELLHVDDARRQLRDVLEQRRPRERRHPVDAVAAERAHEAARTAPSRAPACRA